MIVSRMLLLGILASVAAPACADDCDVAKSAMLASGQTPHTVTITKTDEHGAKSVSRVIQTTSNKYVQMPNSTRWYAMNIAIKDLSTEELKTATFTCRRTGTDAVNGESAVAYQVRMDDEGTVTDSKIWLSPKNRIVKSELHLPDSHSSIVSDYDYDHAAAPAESTSMGGH